jgi:hypothetical protein
MHEELTVAVVLCFEMKRVKKVHLATSTGMPNHIESAPLRRAEKKGFGLKITLRKLIRIEY